MRSVSSATGVCRRQFLWGVLLAVSFMACGCPLRKEASAAAKVSLELKILGGQRIVIGPRQIESLECKGKPRMLQHVWFTQGLSEDVLRGTVPDGEDPIEFMKPFSAKKNMKMGQPFEGDTYRITLYLTQNGSQEISQFTGQNVGKVVAISINGQFVSSPVIKEPIVLRQLHLSTILSTDGAKEISADCPSQRPHQPSPARDREEQITFFLNSLTHIPGGFPTDH